MNDEVSADLEPTAADPAHDFTAGGLTPTEIGAAQQGPGPAGFVSVSVAQPPHWIFALLQSIAVCGIPTQLIVAAALILGTGVSPFGAEGISLEFIATVSFLDTALVALLIRVFLAISRENSSDVYLGRRPVLGEIGRGLALVPVTFLLVVGLVSAVRAVAPWLHNVKVSPLEAFMRNPLDAAIFLVVVVLAGGVREELQRGFILHRFGQRLGGMWVGNLTFGLAFGLLHFDQGWDIALVIGLLGLAWGAFYIRRGSVLVSVANHAGFNAAQVLQQIIVTSMGLGK
ncbi:MAG TPA: type II CAAX endopeptidase family protein [Vicinamibacterales bacterium]|nr:type II CAAX endopeptidase family protein [Vicinamibacterales bacterium]